MTQPPLPERVQKATQELCEKFSSKLVQGRITGYIRCRYNLLLRKQVADVEQQVLADLAEVHPALVSNTSIFSLPAITKLFGYSVDDLQGGTRTRLRERVRKIIEGDEKFISGQVVPISLIMRHAEEIQALFSPEGRKEWQSAKPPEKPSWFMKRGGTKKTALEDGLFSDS